jgi:hypothetical protein
VDYAVGGGRISGGGIHENARMRVTQTKVSEEQAGGVVFMETTVSW